MINGFLTDPLAVASVFAFKYCSQLSTNEYVKVPSDSIIRYITPYIFVESSQPGSRLYDEGGNKDGRFTPGFSAGTAVEQPDEVRLSMTTAVVATNVFRSVVLDCTILQSRELRIITMVVELVIITAPNSY
jgi:hypothetical protein